MSNLHELTKQLDVLTWNSRSVLNALVRSAMAAGSSDGFTVTRAGNKVTLTKMDIFAIYHFYEEWEAEGYPSGDAFNELVSKHDQQYEGDHVVTAALAKHAQVMWLDASNVENINNQSFWLDKISNITNPKWLTNTAPIPLNIRTPIYDENLSTKTYDSYETYLFPSGYYAMDTLGYRGDGTSHSAGGYEWIYDVDKKFHVMTNYALFGDQSEKMQSVYNDVYNYGQAIGFAFAGGTDCFALCDNSIAYGQGNVAAGDNAAVIGGSQNRVYRSDSGVFGGNYNNVVDFRSVIAGGGSNNVNGSTSFAANSSNSIGGYSYVFQRSVKNDDSETKCQNPFEGEDGCLYNLADTGLATSSDGMVELSASQVFISATTRTSSLILDNDISSGDADELDSPLDFKVGDSVTLYEFVVHQAGYNQVVTLGTGTLAATVTAIENVTAKDTGSGGSTVVIGYKVTLDKNITTKTIPALNNRAVQSGRIIKSYSTNYPLIKSDGTVDKYAITYATRDCSVFGYNNIATGQAQTVVGASTLELVRPRFIVGSGSSYIQQSQGFPLERDVSFVSAPNYTYQKTTQYVVAGVSTFTTAYVHGDHNADDTELLRRFDEDYTLAHVEKYEGFYAYSINHLDPDVRSVFRVFHKESVLAINDTGLKLTVPRANQTYSVQNQLYSKEGSVAIYSTDDTAKYDWVGYQKEIVDTDSPTATRAITLWAKDMVAIYGDKARIDTKNGLVLNGPMLGTLTAQPSAEYGLEAHTLQGRLILDAYVNTGHYYTPKVTYRTGFTATDADLGKFWNNPNYTAYHVFESSKCIGDDEYDVAQIIIPGGLTSSCTRALRGTSAIPHPLLCVNDVYNGSNFRRMDGTRMICEQLAYLSDITNTRGGTICYNKGVPAYAAFVDGTVPFAYYTDSTPDVSYTEPNYYVQDSFLYSLWNRDSNLDYTEVASPVTVVSDNEYVEKIIKPAAAFPNYAGQSVTMQADNKSLYLNGVALNPVMNIVTRKRGTNNMTGIGYLAYGPVEIPDTDDLGDEYDYQDYIYINQVAYTDPTDWYKYNLYTSKFSRGTSSSMSPVNMRDVWFTDRHDEEIRWERLMRDLHVTFAGGRLSLEFKLSGYAISQGNLAAVKGVTDTSKSLYGYVEPDGNSKSNMYTDTLIITLPIDPTTGNHLTNLVNAATSVPAQMYGHMYHESDGVDKVDITGIYLNQVPMPLYNPATYPVARPYLYNVPCVQITIRETFDFDDGDYNKAWFFCHLEGVVNYVD